MTRQCRGCGQSFPARPRQAYCWRCYNALHPRRPAKRKPQEMPGWTVVRRLRHWFAKKAGWR